MTEQFTRLHVVKEAKACCNASMDATASNHDGQEHINKAFVYDSKGDEARARALELILRDDRDGAIEALREADIYDAKEDGAYRHGFRWMLTTGKHLVRVAKSAQNVYEICRGFKSDRKRAA